MSVAPEQLAGGPEPQLRVIRVKRKRNSEAPSDLVIHEVVDAKKKRKKTLADALGQMGLGAAPEEGSSAGTAAAVAANALPRRKRYRKLATMTAVEMMETDPQDLRQLLATHPLPSSDVTLIASSSAAPQLHPQQPPAKAARYEQVRMRRGLTNFEITEAARDPLRNIAALHDVVRLDPLPSPDAAGLTPEDGALLCNFLPMVREYLGQQAHAETAAAAVGVTAAAEEEEDAEGMEYVYDLYVEAVEEEKSEESEAWWEMHARGGAPVVQILDDDSWLVMEGSDVSDSDASSEDSNAEGHYGNDYPEEGYLDTDDDSSIGEACGAFGPAGAAASSAGGRRRKEWYDESASSDEETWD